MSTATKTICLSPRPGSFARVEELTGRELGVLRLISAGYSNLAIAEHLFVTERTVEAHTRAIFIKLGCSSRPANTGGYGPYSPTSLEPAAHGRSPPEALLRREAAKPRSSRSTVAGSQ